MVWFNLLEGWGIKWKDRICVDYMTLIVLHQVELNTHDCQSNYKLQYLISVNVFYMGGHGA